MCSFNFKCTLLLTVTVVLKLVESVPVVQNTVHTNILDGLNEKHESSTVSSSLHQENSQLTNYDDDYYFEDLNNDRVVKNQQNLNDRMMGDSPSNGDVVKENHGSVDGVSLQNSQRLIDGYSIPNVNILNDTNGKIFLSRVNSTPIKYTIKNNRNSNVNYHLKNSSQLAERIQSQRIDDIKQYIIATLKPNISSYFPQNLTMPFPTNADLVVENEDLPDISNLPFTEKIQSFFPKCEIPRNTDSEIWNDRFSLNLYFHINIAAHIPEHTLNIAKASLRLFKLFHNDAPEGTEGGNVNFLDSEDKQIRISIYWYTRSLKKNRLKRRLSDSKMIPMYENSTHLGHWIEFNIRPAVRSWIKSGRNLGLGIVIEDQEGNFLQTDRFIKNMECNPIMDDTNKASYFASNNRTIPRPVFEAALIAAATNITNSTSSFRNSAPRSSNILLYPTLDLCMLEIPYEYRNRSLDISKHKCKFKNISFVRVNHEDVYNIFNKQSQTNINHENDDELLQNDDARIRNVLGQDESNENKEAHKIRHERKLNTKDVRNYIENQKIIMTREEFLKLFKLNSSER